MPVAFAAALAFCTLRYLTVPVFDAAGLEAIAHGRSVTPFQFRVAIPFLARALVELGRLTGLRIGYDGAEFAIDVASLTAVLVIAGRMLDRLSLARAWLLVLLYILVVDYIVQFGLTLREGYDFPELLFAFAAVILIRDQRYGWFELMLGPAMLVRESAAFLTVLFAITEWSRLPRAQWLRHLALQLAIIAAVKLALWLAFRHVPGAGALPIWGHEIGGPHDWTDTRLEHNLEAVLRLKLLPVFGGVWLPLAIYWRRLSDPFFRRAIWLVPIVFAAMMLVGNIIEFRVFTELVPIIFFSLALARGR